MLTATCFSTSAVLSLLAVHRQNEETDRSRLDRWSARAPSTDEPLRLPIFACIDNPISSRNIMANGRYLPRLSRRNYQTWQINLKERRQVPQDCIATPHGGASWRGACPLGELIAAGTAWLNSRAGPGFCPLAVLLQLCAASGPLTERTSWTSALPVSTSECNTDCRRTSYWRIRTIVTDISKMAVTNSPLKHRATLQGQSRQCLPSRHGGRHEQTYLCRLSRPTYGFS